MQGSVHVEAVSCEYPNRKWHFWSSI